MIGQADEETDGEEAQDPEEGAWPDRATWRYGEWDCYTHDEKKTREDEIGGSETIPFRVIEEPWRGWSLIVDHYHSDHGETPESI